VQKEWIAKVTERNSNQPPLGQNDFSFGGNKMLDTLSDLKNWMVENKSDKLADTA